MGCVWTQARSAPARRGARARAQTRELPRAPLEIDSRARGEGRCVSQVAESAGVAADAAARDETMRAAAETVLRSLFQQPSA